MLARIGPSSSRHRRGELSHPKRYEDISMSEHAWPPRATPPFTWGVKKVALKELGQDKLVHHIIDLYSRAQLKTSAEWLDERARPDGRDAKRQLREAQNDEAIGGLRSPPLDIECKGRNTVRLLAADPLGRSRKVWTRLVLWNCP